MPLKTQTCTCLKSVAVKLVPRVSWGEGAAGDMVLTPMCHTSLGITNCHVSTMFGVSLVGNANKEIWCTVLGTLKMFVFIAIQFLIE